MIRIGAVIIGRNEGTRLVASLASFPDGVARVVYVDSGSTDGSVEAARAAGAQVVALNMDRPFTAARARNAGFVALQDGGAVDFVQFVDGDCMLQPGWIDTAAAFLQANPQAAVVCGRRRERFPEASVYNRLCDREWNTPVGRALACGGDAMMRADAFAAAGGFDPSMIAGEEPELCVRLRAAGWEVWRIDAEMALHDAAMARFSQWWQRMRRGGHAAAEGAAIHGRRPERLGVAQTRRALVWGLTLPAVAGLGALLTPWTLGLLLAWPAQVARLALRDGAGRRDSWEWASFVTLGKIPEALGVLEYHLRRITGHRRRLIEYKGVSPSQTGYRR
jgi:GT2 family glycosyltransferase